MLFIAGVREAEPWSPANIVGGLLLVAAVIALLVWLIRRYLKT